MESKKNQLVKVSKSFADAALLSPLVELLSSQNVKPTEVFKGIIRSEKSDLISRAIEIGESFLRNNYTERILGDIKELQKKGEIKEDYFPTNQAQATLLDFLKFIDEKPPDEELFKALKSIFLSSVIKDTEEKDRILAYELLQICKQLKSGDVIVLKSCFGENKKNNFISKHVTTINNWINPIIEDTGLPKELIEIQEKNLMKYNLIHERQIGNESYGDIKNFRLTGLGIKLCESITRY